MAQTRAGQLNLLVAAGLLIYAVALGSPLLLQRYFWTNEAMGQQVPWYFMGRTLIAGACAALGLLLTLALGVVAGRRLGPAVWGSLVPALLFLSVPVGQGLSVLLYTERIWAGAASAASRWRTFDEYLYGTTLAGLLTLAVACAVLFRFRSAWSDRSAPPAGLPPP